MSPEELRAQAAELIKQAEAEEYRLANVSSELCRVADEAAAEVEKAMQAGVEKFKAVLEGFDGDQVEEYLRQYTEENYSVGMVDKRLRLRPCRFWGDPWLLEDLGWFSSSEVSDC